MREALGSGWAALVDELERDLQRLDPPGKLIGTEVDAIGLPRFRVKLDRRVRAQGRILVREVQGRAAKMCEECGGPGQARAGAVVTVTCDHCDPDRSVALDS
jgi:hypothetical protein